MKKSLVALMVLAACAAGAVAAAVPVVAAAGLGPVAASTCPGRLIWPWQTVITRFSGAPPVPYPRT